MIFDSICGSWNVLGLGNISLRYIAMAHNEGTSFQIFLNENQIKEKYATQDVG